MNRFRAYIPFSKGGFLTAIAYRTHILGFLVGELLFSFIMYYLWKTVFANTGGTLLGFTFSDMVVFIFLSNATRFLIHSEATYTVAEEIMEGSISMRLIKPVRLDLSLMFTDLGGTILTFLLIFIPMLIGIEIYRYVEFGVWMISPVKILLFLFSASLSFLVNFYFDLCFGFMAFFLKNLWGFSILKQSMVNFLSGSMIPLDFLPKIFADPIKLMPFASISYTPVMIFMGKYSGSTMVNAIILQLFWVVILYLISSLIFSIAKRYLSVQGG